MAAKTESPYPLVEVSAVVITDDRGRVLLDFNGHWSAFTLPMQKRHELPPEVPNGTATVETWLAAATRAAAEVLGRPLDPAILKPLEAEVQPFTQSSRDGVWKHYTYRVFALKVSGEPKPLPGHTAVWVAPAEIDTLAPISPTVAKILNAIPL